jgi:hypothetical protein
MQFKSGYKYLISYKDPNYPCHCLCHKNPNVRHIVACCGDKSFENMECVYCGQGDKYADVFEPIDENLKKKIILEICLHELKYYIFEEIQ